ncbi:MAG: hypothetical protein R3E02_16000 [Blastomonas sp.]
MKFDPHQLWTGQQIILQPVSEEELRNRSEKMDRRIRRRDLIEYLAAALVIIPLALIAWKLPILSIRLAILAMIAGVIMVCINLYRRRDQGADAIAAMGLSWRDCHMRQLRHQRDILGNVASWYIGPLVPGAFGFLAAICYETASRIGWIDAAAGLAGPFAFVTLLFAGIIALNRRAAHLINQQIEALESELG